MSHISPRERAIWQAACGVAHKACLDHADRLHERRLGGVLAYAAIDCAAKVREGMDLDDDALAAVLDAAGVPTERGPRPRLGHGRLFGAVER